MNTKRFMPSPSTERAVNKIVIREMKIERELRELVKKKIELYRADRLRQQGEIKK
jgi:hypothetical protein